MRYVGRVLVTTSGQQPRYLLSSAMLQRAYPLTSDRTQSIRAPTQPDDRGAKLCPQRRLARRQSASEGFWIALIHLRYARSRPISPMPAGPSTLTSVCGASAKCRRRFSAAWMSALGPPRRTRRQRRAAILWPRWRWRACPEIRRFSAVRRGRIPKDRPDFHTAAGAPSTDLRNLRDLN